MKTLRPYRHKKFQFFIADDIDICTFRDEIASMEHPFFALKAGDTKTRAYQNGRVTIIVRSSADIGLATIFDKDIWIYAISKLQEAMNNNQLINRTVTFTPYDFFVTTNRSKGGRAYGDLEKALSRLSGTRIKTNIVYSENNKKTIDFGLIDNWELLEKKKGRLNIGMISVTLPEWLYQAITKTKVLQISSDYFRIRKAIDRRLYEIARKHCGNQNEFIISLDKLHLKTGSSSNKREFRRLVKNLCSINDLPDYEIFYALEADHVTFKNRNQHVDRWDSIINYIKEKQHMYNTQKNIISKSVKKLGVGIVRKKFIRDINILPILDKKIPRGFRG